MSSFTVILSAGLAAGLLLTVRPAAAQEETSFKLAGTDTYIRHQNSQGVLSKIGFNDNVARKDATFRLQFGLAGKCVSLESVNFPGQYLRHQNFWIVLAKNDNTPLFKSDATFCTKNPLPMGVRRCSNPSTIPAFSSATSAANSRYCKARTRETSGGTRPSNAARPRTQTDRTEPLSIRAEQAVRSTEIVDALIDPETMIGHR